MGRPMIDQEKKKRTVSITLTPEQIQLLRWSAAETDENTSVFIGQLIEREARKISKKKQKPLPNLEQNQLQWTTDGQVTAMKSVRDLCKKGNLSKPVESGRKLNEKSS